MQALLCMRLKAIQESNDYTRVFPSILQCNVFRAKALVKLGAWDKLQELGKEYVDAGRIITHTEWLQISELSDVLKIKYPRLAADLKTVFLPRSPDAVNYEEYDEIGEQYAAIGIMPTADEYRRLAKVVSQIEGENRSSGQPPDIKRKAEQYRASGVYAPYLDDLVAQGGAREAQAQTENIADAKKRKRERQAAQDAQEEAERREEEKAQSQENFSLMMQGITALGEMAAASKRQKSAAVPPQIGVPPAARPRSSSTQNSSTQVGAAEAPANQPSCNNTGGRTGFITYCRCRGGTFKETYDPTMKDRMGREINGARQWECKMPGGGFGCTVFNGPNGQCLSN